MADNACIYSLGIIALVLELGALFHTIHSNGTLAICRKMLKARIATYSYN